jgi:tRNA A37 threonylcarbamoyltransferase TsaD
MAKLKMAVAETGINQIGGGVSSKSRHWQTLKEGEAVNMLEKHIFQKFEYTTDNAAILV